jgi:signal transduction histidine kinase
MSSSMIIIEDYGESLNDAIRSELVRQSDAARSMNKMLEELLQLSRLSRRPVTRAKVDLGEVLSQVALKRGLVPSQFEPCGGLSAFADADLMQTLISNLVDNSIKFCPEGRQVHLHLYREDKWFFLRDNGIGFTPEQGQRVFLPFEKVHGGSYPGAGMGLAQAKRIVAMHDGEISALGEPGDGATITFSLES